MNAFKHGLAPLLGVSLLAMAGWAAETPSTMVTTCDDVVDPNDGRISFREAIAYAGTNGLGNEITFRIIDEYGSVDYIALEGPITLDRNLVVRGINLVSGAAIEYDYVQITVPEGISAVFCEGTMRGGGGMEGGAFNNAGTLRCEHVAFSFSSADFGGAIHNEGMLTLDSCRFAGCSAEEAGGAICNLGTVKASNTSFQNCNAYRMGGGGVYNVGTFVAENCSISSCSSEGEVDWTYDEATDDWQSEILVPGYGGFLCNEGSAVFNGGSAVNCSDTGGGQFCWNAEDGVLRMNNMFVGCLPGEIEDSASVAGAVGSDVVILNSSFFMCGMEGGGGILIGAAPSRASLASVAPGTSGYCHVRLDDAPSRMLVMNCAFDLPRASAICGDATVRGSAFGSVYMDAVAENGETLAEVRRRVAGEIALSCVVPQPEVAVSQPGVLLRNHANALEWKDVDTWKNAGVDIVDLAGESLEYDVFGDERATIANGLVFPGATANPSAPESLSDVVTTAEDIVDPTDGLVSLREAFAYAYYLCDSYGISISSVSFAPELEGREVYIDNGPITCSTKGSRIYLTGPESRVDIVVRNGGGALVVTNALLWLTRVNFRDASSVGNGGAVNSTALAGVQIENCSFSNCVAGASGGAVYSKGEAQLRYCQFKDCHAAGDGGGFCGNCYFMGEVSFDHCSASGRGGAACQEGELVLDAFGVSAEFCSANVGGGFHYERGEIHDARFGNCSASYRGGALFGGSVDIDRCTFVGNTAPRGAAAWFSDGDTHACIVNSTIVDCTASAEGAILESCRPMNLGNCSELNCLSGDGRRFSAGVDGAKVVALNCLLPDQPDDGLTITFGTSLLGFHGNLGLGYGLDDEDGLPQRYSFYPGGYLDGTPPVNGNAFMHVAVRPKSSAGTLVGSFTVGDDMRLAYFGADNAWHDESGAEPQSGVTTSNYDQTQGSRGNNPETYGIGALIGSGVRDARSMVVTTFRDRNDDYDGRISLQEAIANAEFWAELNYIHNRRECRIEFDVDNFDHPVIAVTNDMMLIAGTDRYRDGLRLVIDGALPGGRRVRIDLGGHNAFLKIPAGNAVTLRNLEIVNGKADLYSSRKELGTIDCSGLEGEPLRIENCLFENCSAQPRSSMDGNAYSVVRVVSGDVEIRQTEFRGTAEVASVVNVESGRLTADGCLFASNYVGRSVLNVMKADVDNCVFRGNLQYGVVSGQSLVNVFGDSSNGADTLINCAFVDNSLYLGHVLGVGGDLDVANVTAAGNAGGYFATVEASGTLRLVNSIVADSLCPNACAARVIVEGNLLSTVGEVIERNVGGLMFASYTPMLDANPGNAVGCYVENGSRRICRRVGGVWYGVGNARVDVADVAVVGTDLFGGSRLLGGDNWPYYTCGALSDNAVELIVTTVADVVDPDDGVVSLREAITAAESGMTTLAGRRRISFAIAGNRNPVFAIQSTIMITNSAVFTAERPLEIHGDNGRGRVTFDGCGQVQLFRVEGDAGFTLSNCTVRQGKGQLGGALYSDGPTTLSGVTFADCAASSMGGAVFGLDILAEDCTFTNCVSANNGGAVYVDYEKGWNMAFRVSNCVFVGNAAKGDGSGGAVYVRAGAEVEIDGAAFVGNQATDGGAIYLGSSVSAQIGNCSFMDNDSKWEDSGVIHVRGAELELRHVTSWGNTCQNGDPILVENYSGNVVMGASLVGENVASPDWSDEVIVDEVSVYGAAASRFDSMHGRPVMHSALIRGVQQRYLKPTESSVFDGPALALVDQLGSIRTVDSPTLGAVDCTAIPHEDEPESATITHPDLLANCDLDAVDAWVAAQGLEVDGVNDSEHALASFLLNTPLQTSAPELAIVGISQGADGKWRVKVHASATYGGAKHDIALGHGTTPAINGKLTLSVAPTVGGPWTMQEYRLANLAFDADGDAVVTAASGAFFKAVITP